MGQEIFFLCSVFFLIAIVYSSAGFGGGSSYLAVLSFTSLEFTDVRIIALCCNIIVVLGSTILFSKYLDINWRRILPLIILSVPLAYFGGRFPISQELFFIVLACCLLVASFLMLVEKVQEVKQFPKFSNALLGGGIGFLSGIVGIGGGIFLSPLLHISRWGRPKIIAATAALFILVNSIAGLIGQLSTNEINFKWNILLPLLLCVFMGGQIGVRTSILKFSPRLVKQITAIVILVVAVRILIKYLF